ncbi:MAG: hypothetical protein WC449_05910 [Candidatus Paceibacterota bacterium]
MRKYKDYIYRITWDGVTGANVKLDYCIGGTGGPWNAIIASTTSSNLFAGSGFYNWTVPLAACLNLYVRIWDLTLDALFGYVGSVDVVENSAIHIQHYGDSISKLGIYPYVEAHTLANHSTDVYEVDVVNDQGIVGMWMGYYNNFLLKGDIFTASPLPDIVLLNSGMHDRKYVANEFYLKINQFLNDYKQRNPRAILVWGTTTHVATTLPGWETFNATIDSHTEEALDALSNIWYPGRYVIADILQAQIDNSVPFVDDVHPTTYDYYGPVWCDALDQAIAIYNAGTIHDVPMASVPLVAGVERIVKITPNAAYAVDNIPAIDQVVKIVALADAKFDDFNTIVGGDPSKLAVMDSVAGTKCLKYADANLNMVTHSGHVWFEGVVNPGRSFFLQAGSALAETNSSLVFTNQGQLISCGFNEAAGNPVNRSGGAISGTVANITYGAAATLDKAFDFNGNNSNVHFGQPLNWNGASRFELIMLISQDVLDVTDLWFRYYADATHGIQVRSFTDGTLKFHLFANAYPSIKFDYSTAFAAGQLRLLHLLYDGDLYMDDGRGRVFVNGVNIKNIPASGYVYDIIPTVVPTISGVENMCVGFSASALDGKVDEIRVGVNVRPDPLSISWRANNLLQADYWTATIQPLITDITYLGNGRWQITGSGFLVGGVDPTGTIGGVAWTVEGVATDTVVIVVQGATPIGTQDFIITNNDGESFVRSIGQGARRYVNHNIGVHIL